MKVTCKFCGRYLFEQVGTVVIENLVCKCGAHLNFKVINNDVSKDVNYKFINKEIPPKEKKDETNSN